MKNLLNLIKKSDPVLISSVILILLIGCLTLYSASYQRSLITGKSYILTQVCWIVIGFIVCFVVISVPYKKWIAAGPYLYAAGLLLLIAVLFFGSVRGGARRWFTVAGVSFQPSEMIRFGLVLILSSYLGQRLNEKHSYKLIILGFLMAILPAILVLKQPNLGIAVSFLFITGVMLWVWGLKWKHFLTLLISGIVSVPLIWPFLREYQKQRIFAFLNPEKDPLGSGYSIIQSRIAIGSGEFWGRGWMHGSQNRLNFVPEKHTDFIFSVLSEEFGFLGASVLILLFVIFFYRCIKIALQTHDASARLLVFGMASSILYQLVINISMTIGLVPVVGVPLPLISYGGSNMLVVLAGIGMILNISARRTVF